VLLPAIYFIAATPWRRLREIAKVRNRRSNSSIWEKRRAPSKYKSQSFQFFSLPVINWVPACRRSAL
jgi:hypothetical protein